MFPRSSFVQLLQLGWSKPNKLLTQRSFLKLATTNQEEELTEDLCGVGLLEGHSVRLGEVDVGAGLSEGGGGVGASTCRSKEESAWERKVVAMTEASVTHL